MRVRCGERRERSKVASQSLEFFFAVFSQEERCSRHRNNRRGHKKKKQRRCGCNPPTSNRRPPRKTSRLPMIASAATARSPHKPVLIAALMIVVATAFWTRVSKLSVEAWDSPISAAAVKATDFNGTVIVLSWTDCSADDGDRHARHFTQSAAAPGRPVFTLTHNNRPTHCEGSQCV